MKIVFTLLASGVLLFGFAVSAQAPAEKPLANFEGKPAFAEGIDTGYYVWRDGDKWSVRWTTTGKLRHFTGAVTAEGGELKSLKRIDVESERRVLYPGRAPRIAVGPRGRVYRRGGAPPVVATREQDKFEKDGDGRIVYNSRTDDDIDGFDFKTDAKVTALRFVLEIDGQFRPQLIETGKGNQKAGNVPFIVRLK
ncbi:MAG: hypothetical protein HOP19_09395 [Acidobacteria bacterium]|nr:hypothetical protein [Acidobacteriota bacterium]